MMSIFKNTKVMYCTLNRMLIHLCLNKEKGSGTLYPGKNCLLTGPPNMAGTTHNVLSNQKFHKVNDYEATSDSGVDSILVSARCTQ